MVITSRDAARIIYDLFDDECPCNYNDISDRMGIEICCDDCPTDKLACWKKYVELKVNENG